MLCTWQPCRSAQLLVRQSGVQQIKLPEAMTEALQQPLDHDSHHLKQQMEAYRHSNSHIRFSASQSADTALKTLETSLRELSLPRLQRQQGDQRHKVSQTLDQEGSQGFEMRVTHLHTSAYTILRGRRSSGKMLFTSWLHMPGCHAQPAHRRMCLQNATMLQYSLLLRTEHLQEQHMLNIAREVFAEHKMLKYSGMCWPHQVLWSVKLACRIGKTA